MTVQPWDDTPWDETAEVLEGEVVVAESADVALALAEPLSMDEARELTETIRSTADVLYVLLHRAHAGRAWEALGYGSFETYVREEFDISRSRAYQILNQAKVIEAIEAAAPEGTDLRITEAQARDLKSVLGEVVPEIESRTRDLPANEAAEVVEEIVEEFREAQREKREERAAAEEAEAADRAERNAILAEAGYEYSGDYRPAPVTDDEDPIDLSLIRRNVQAAYDLYSSLSALKSMPDHQSVIDTIPVERRIQINDSLPTALGWLTEFSDLWFAQPWQSDVTAEAADDYDDFGDEPEV